MHCPPLQFKKAPFRTGFSLVEVVLALGLCSFALVSLISLLPVSLDAAKNAVEISRKAKITQQMVAELSQSRFTNVTALSGSSKQKTFDYEGLPTTNSASIYYTASAKVESLASLPGLNAGSPSLARVIIEIRTPHAADTSKTAVVLSDMGY